MAAHAHPSIVITLAVEAQPRVQVLSMSAAEEDRVVDWVRSHEGLAGLVQRALELAKEARAAS